MVVTGEVDMHTRQALPEDGRLSSLASDEVLAQPPLPDEEPPTDAISTPASPTAEHPSLPDEPVPESQPEESDGWQAILDQASQRYYFHNACTGETTWTNPRAPSESVTQVPSDYATHFGHSGPTSDVAFKVQFNKRTGKFVRDPEKTVENFTSDGRGERQLKAFFDPETFNQEGKSFRAERAQAQYSKKEMQEMKKRYKEKREQKKRSWLTKESDNVDERRKRKYEARR